MPCSLPVFGDAPCACGWCPDLRYFLPVGTAHLLEHLHSEKCDPHSPTPLDAILHKSLFLGKRALALYPFFKSYYYCSIVDFLCCVSFTCTAKWVSYTHTYMHSFCPLSSLITWDTALSVLNRIRASEPKNVSWSGFYLRLLSKNFLEYLVTYKGSQSWILIRRTDVEAETPILWPPDVKNWLIGNDPGAGKDWRREEKGTTEDEMVGWHRWLNGHEFE